MLSSGDVRIASVLASVDTRSAGCEVGPELA